MVGVIDLVTGSSNRKARKKQNQAADRQLRLQAEDQKRADREAMEVQAQRSGRLRALRGRSGSRSLLAGGQETGDFQRPTTFG